MGLDRIHPQARTALRPPRRLLCATDELRKQSAARNVVPDDQEATIWRESGARVRMAASTHSDLDPAGIHIYLCGPVDAAAPDTPGGASVDVPPSMLTGIRAAIEYSLSAARRGGTFHFGR